MELAKGEGIKFTGFIPEEEKLRILQQAKILLSCSEFEGFGTVPIEALACGAFPVVSDIPAHREVVGEHGILFREVSEAVYKICDLLHKEGGNWLRRVGNMWRPPTLGRKYATDLCK